MSRLKLVCSIVLYATAIILLGLSLCGFLNSPPYWIDNLSQLRLLYTIPLIILLIVSALIRAGWSALIGAFALAVNTATFLPLYFSAPVSQGGF